jgi:hypothetical protein
VTYSCLFALIERGKEMIGEVMMMRQGDGKESRIIGILRTNDDLNTCIFFLQNNQIFFVTHKGVRRLVVCVWMNRGKSV